MMMRLSNLIEAQQLSKDILFELFVLADSFRTGAPPLLQGKILATLFYEPSTRTRLSFESAMMRLGGSVISSENAKEFSSAVKGESIEDTARIVGGYADCIVVRHYDEGTAKRAAAVSPVPIISAGDGKGQHPTQALLDIYTIYRELGRVENFTIAMVGDLSSGRTVRSLCYLLGKFGGISIIFVAPSHLRMRDDIKDYLRSHDVVFREEEDLNIVLPTADIIYMTRIQKERMTDEEYMRAKGTYVLNEKSLTSVKATARIMHPLPHVEEIDIPVVIEQQDPRIAYFRQAQNGLFIRMALLAHLLH